MFKIGLLSPFASLTCKPRFLCTSKSVYLKNYYDILQVSKNSSPAQVKKAYYQLAKRHHPDRNPNDPKAKTVFQNIVEAYEVLSDAKKRLEYDNIGRFTSGCFLEAQLDVVIHRGCLAISSGFVIIFV